MVCGRLRGSTSRMSPQRSSRSSCCVSFFGMVLPGDELKVMLMCVMIQSSRSRQSVIAGRRFSKGLPKLRNPPLYTFSPAKVYVYNNTRSRHLYELSRAAWAVDGADAHLPAVYDFSIIEIVKDIPTEKTIHFGGIKGPSVNDRPTVGRSKLLHSSVISQCPNIQAHV
jgi:fatty acid synthase subunit alpha